MRLLPAAFLLTALTALPASAEEYVLTLKDHTFIPQELTIPADKRVTLVIKNEDSTAAEFESHDFKREKVINPHSQSSLLVGPLSAGSYEFFDEFHEGTKGKLIVK